MERCPMCARARDACPMCSGNAETLAGTQATHTALVAAARELLEATDVDAHTLYLSLRSLQALDALRALVTT